MRKKLRTLKTANPKQKKRKSEPSSFFLSY
jgi:hypothetical protein